VEQKTHRTNDDLNGGVNRDPRACTDAAPLVSIVVLNYNGKDLLRECLESIRRLHYRNFETIVVDNSSTDGSAEMIRTEYSWTTLLITPPIRIAQASNSGLRLAKGQVIVPLLNNDMTVDEHWLDHLVEALRQPEVGIVDSKVYCYGTNMIKTAGNAIKWNTGDVKGTGFGHLDRGQYDAPREVDYAEVTVVRRDVVERIGRFDEEYLFYWSDIDYCVRAKKAGYKTMYVPTAVVWHREAATIGENSPRRYYSYTRDSLRFLIKHSPASLIGFRWLCASLATMRKIALHLFAGRIDLVILQVRAFTWNLTNMKETMRMRGRVRLPV
jgi:GT2 family glycosyltransferase